MPLPSDPVPSKGTPHDNPAPRTRGRVLRAAAVTLGVVTVLVGAALVRRTEPSEAPGVARERLPTPQPRFQDALDVSVFQRGNLHAHSARTDGDSPAQLVFAWYRDHGYQFLALTDHNSFIDGARHPDLQTEGFVILPGEEITMVAAGLPVHVNALCTQERIGGGTFRTPADALTWATASILAQDGVALVNHPNFHYALAPQDILEAHGAQLLEIWSGHPHVRSDGDATHASAEAKWEQVLASGHPMAAVAVDDMHALIRTTKNVPQSPPGTGWVEVFAEETSQDAICDALRAGQLYASSGPRLTRLTVADDVFALELDTPDVKVEFLDRSGLLATVKPSSQPPPEPSPPEQSPTDRLAKAGEEPSPVLRATYQLRGTEQYVRARLTAPDGTRAWTQPYWVAH